jgi:acetolactate synthase-1/3 small subunit
MKIPAAKRAEFKALADIFRADIVDISDRHMTVSLAAPEREVDTFLSLAAPFGITETVRAGRIALRRGV